MSTLPWSAYKHPLKFCIFRFAIHDAPLQKFLVNRMIITIRVQFRKFDYHPAGMHPVTFIAFPFIDHSAFTR
jgi:hypothetical protein